MKINHLDSNSVMESRDQMLLSVAEEKNGARPKSQMSRGNFLKKLLLACCAIVLSVSCMAQENKAVTKQLKHKYASVFYVNSGGGWYCVRLNGKKGACDLTGNEIILPKYDVVVLSSDGFFKVISNDKTGAFDLSGNEIVPCKYENVIKSNGSFQVKTNGEYQDYSTSMQQKIVQVESKESTIATSQKDDLRDENLLDENKEETLKSITPAYALSIGENNKNLISELSKKGNKVYIMVENIDSIVSFPKIVMRHMRNLGYWKIVDNMNDADMVLVFAGFTWPTDKGIFLFEGYVKVFDNKMNFIYRGDYLWKGGFVAPWNTLDDFVEKTIKALINNLPNNLKDARVSKTSPFYESKSVKNFDESKYEIYFNSLLESIENGQNKKILENVNRCIMINPELPELYEIKSAVLLEMKKKSFESIKKLILLDPLNSNIDYYWQIARYQKAVRNARLVAAMSVTTSAINVASASYTAIRAISATSTASTSHMASTSTNNLPKNTTKGSTLQRETCSFCKGTGVSPIPKSGPIYAETTKQWCDVCKNWEYPHYHPSCPSCNGKGYNLRSVR